MKHAHSIMDSPAELAGVAAVAALVSAVVTLVIMPKAGPDTRNQIRDKAREMRYKMNVAKKTMSHKMHEGAKDVADATSASEISSSSKDTAATEVLMDQTKPQMRKTAAQLKAEADHIRQHGEA